MLALLYKEINSFFSSLTGYIVIFIFLVSNGLFLWVFPSEFNVIDSGYASIEPLFALAPWIFLFLVPAVTMRLFADEQRSGTIELLLTRPLTDLQIVLAKYLAGLLLVLFSLLPTLIYYFSVVQLSDSTGIDHGATLGSYIGLFFLAAIYVAIGVFASSTTENQIIAFLAALFLSFFLYVGFEMIASFSVWQNINDLVINLGINEHYKSMSRGVIDTRDMLYFLSVIALFIGLSKTVLESRKW